MNTRLVNREERKAWAILLDFAADLYLNEPNRERLANCQAVGQQLIGVFPNETFPKMFALAEAKSDAETLQEYFDLFFVPVSDSYLPPFEAAYREKQLTAKLPVLIDQLYTEAGFAPQKLRIPAYMRSISRPDHIGLEMAFLACILTSSLSLETDGALEQAKILQETALSFHSMYLGKWASLFGKKLLETADSHLYKGLASLTQFIDREFIRTFDNKKTIKN